MKTLAYFMVIIVCVSCRFDTAPSAPSEKINESVFNLIVRQGYHAKLYAVETEDGYILDLVRIPHQRQPGGTPVQLSSREDSQENQQKPAVLLMSGMMSTYEDFVVGGAEQGLAFRLAEAGYDVYMGNARGSFFGQKHDTLNPERDTVFWKHCWYEIATKDLPALIDTVRTISGQQKIDYIGHMGGTTIFYVLASEKPEYNERFNKMVSLGPIAYMKHAKNEFLKQLDSKIVTREVYILQNTQQQTSTVWNSGWITRSVGLNTYGLSEDLLQKAEDDCRGHAYDIKVCSNIYFLVNGYNSNHYNMTTIDKLLPRVPSPASSKQILHYLQLMISGRFQVYNETFDRHHQAERVFDLTKITTPIMVYYAGQDTWSQPEDVQHLMRELPNVVYSERVDTVSNNMDLLFSKNVTTNVFDPVIQKMKNTVTMTKNEM